MRPECSDWGILSNGRERGFPTKVSSLAYSAMKAFTAEAFPKDSFNAKGFGEVRIPPQDTFSRIRVGASRYGSEGSS